MKRDVVRCFALVIIPILPLGVCFSKQRASRFSRTARHDGPLTGGYSPCAKISVNTAWVVSQ